MNVNIQAVHFVADRKLIDYVENKIRKLETFNGRIVEVMGLAQQAGLNRIGFVTEPGRAPVKP